MSIYSLSYEKYSVERFTTFILSSGYFTHLLHHPECTSTLLMDERLIPFYKRVLDTEEHVSYRYSYILFQLSMRSIRFREQVYIPMTKESVARATHLILKCLQWCHSPQPYQPYYTSGIEGRCNVTCTVMKQLDTWKIPYDTPTVLSGVNMYMSNIKYRHKDLYDSIDRMYESICLRTRTLRIVSHYRDVSIR